jgi:hypothetical protein
MRDAVEYTQRAQRHRPDDLDTLRAAVAELSEMGLTEP